MFDFDSKRSSRGFGFPPQGPPQGANSSYYYNPNHRPSPSPGPGPGYGPQHNRIPSPNPPMNMAGFPPAPPSPQPHPQTQQGCQTFHLRQSDKTHKIILIHGFGQPVSAPPLYSLTSSPKSSNADYVLARGADPNDPQALVASVKSHTFSSKYDLVVRGTTCTLRPGTMGDKYKIEIPQMGLYKWHTDEEGMSSKMWLKDERGNVLVTYDKSKAPSSKSTWKKFVGGRERDLEFHVPMSEFFVEVSLVSIYAVKMAKEGALEVAGEVVGALAGG
ncbi:uncharacterized protein BJX67DRAFT_213206 [Aspergillus lucknowensis]|uniref:Uncharacterized protein n=1 Tax=Aspergillus lucknowensis TaxID=176173 RepID=A0ABR4M359_9EURO